jgi:DNA-binding transcriptional ArsR family regulator
VTTIKRHSALLIPSLIFVVVMALFVMPGWKQRGRRSISTYLPAPAIATASELAPWTQAIQKIKEDRGEPTGKQAKVDIPHQVRHYSDTRRFLAIQVAEVREHGFETPKDLVDLAGMIKRGEMVVLKPVTENYILFGVGGSASKDSFTRYEKGKSIGLYSESGLQQEYARISGARATVEKEVAGLRKDLASLGKRERSKRSKLQAQIATTEKRLKAEREDKELLDRYYGNAQKRAQLFSDYESLASLAKSLPDRDFNIEEAAGRRDLKVRMLSSLRPEALVVMEEIAASYREKFHRPLPITSLVRPDEYQHQLSKTNPNATRIETPPHSTGLAFDIYYRFMTAEEQAHVMDHLARLKDAGRIEVLRENRDHYHVFAFVDGERPNESLIGASLGKTAAVKAAKPAKTSAKAVKKAKKKSVKSKAVRAKTKRRR